MLEPESFPDAYWNRRFLFISVNLLLLQNCISLVINKLSTHRNSVLRNWGSRRNISTNSNIYYCDRAAVSSLKSPHSASVFLLLTDNAQTLLTSKKCSPFRQSSKHFNAPSKIEILNVSWGNTLKWLKFKRWFSNVRDSHEIRDSHENSQ